MSLRGEVVIECDSPDCHAEQVIPAKRLRVDGVWAIAKDWLTESRERDICPQCADEIDEGKRCGRCLVKLDPGYTCGDCYGGTERDPAARSWETAAWPFDRMN